MDNNTPENVTDIIGRLRTWADTINQTSERVRITMLHSHIFTEAADEIERLRARQEPSQEPSNTP